MGKDCGHGDDHGHAHSHGPGHHHHHHHIPEGADIPRALKRAIAVTLFFMVVELVGGFVSNSLALMSDAGHMLTDVGALSLSLFAYWMSRRPSTPKMTFGYHRAEILGALASGLTIWLIAGFLIYEAVLRFREPPEVQGSIVLVVAAIGLGANLFSMWSLNSARKENMNVRAAYLHVLADSLGSVGAMVAGGVLILTGWRPIDLVVSIVFSALMLYSSWSLVKESVGILMESTPTHVDSSAVQADLAALQGVQEVHDLHIWTVSSGRLALSVHLISREGEKTLNAAHEILREKYSIVHTTIQVEHPEKFQSERCYDCAHG